MRVSRAMAQVLSSEVTFWRNLMHNEWKMISYPDHLSKHGIMLRVLEEKFEEAVAVKNE